MSDIVRRKLKALFVSHRGNFDESSGGAQICSKEYLDTIRAAGVETHLHLLDLDRRLTTRLYRRLVSSSSYGQVAPRKQIEGLRRTVADTLPDLVLLNQVNLAGLAPTLKPALGKSGRIVLLSHGLESTDLLHHIRAREILPLTGRIRPTAAAALGAALISETKLRRYVDGALVLSPFDAALEAWLGTHNINWVPRVVHDQRLEWRPTGDRLGYLGSIDHAPNFEGLVQAIEVIRAARGADSLRIRIVGGPRHSGAWLQSKYPCVDYLGPLSDSEAREEASTWNAFIHPIFCAARGCSTKLAGAIGWGLPIITTKLGHRGYAWREGSLTVGNTPDEFAARCTELLDLKVAARAREEVFRVLATSTSLKDVADQISSYFVTLGANR